MVNLLDAGSVLSAYGWVGIAVVLFAETGLLIGFFLPGDTLLFTAGLLCTSAGASAHTKLSLPLVLLAAVFGALAGAQTGFVLGRRGGRALLTRSKNKHLHKGVARAEEILGKYGHAKAIVLARFIPVVRTVLNPMAGAVGVPARTFAIWQVAGGLVWSAGLVVGGYVLGSSIPNVDKYLLPIIAVIFLVSVTPLVLELLRTRKQGKAQAVAAAGSQPGGAQQQGYGPRQRGAHRQGRVPQYGNVSPRGQAQPQAGRSGGQPGDAHRHAGEGAQWHGDLQP
jgi:membrane-associated protein